MKIVHQRQKCIGCGSCAAVCPDFWETADDGLVNLKGAVTNQETGDDELEIAEIGCNQDAINTCPVQIIKIVK